MTRCLEIRANTQADRWTNRETDSEKNKKAEKQTEKQTDGQTSRELAIGMQILAAKIITYKTHKNAICNQVNKQAQKINENTTINNYNNSDRKLCRHAQYMYNM